MTLADEVIRYYEDCHTDYRLAWGIDRNRSIHYGYYENGIRGRHAARENSNRVLMRELALGNQALVVDAGCGIGGTSLWIAHRISARLLGINIQPMQIEIARKLAAEQGLGHRVSFQLGDYCAMPVADGAADAVFSLEGVAHAPDKGRFIAEAARILRPGGRLVIFDYFGRADPLCARDARELARFMSGWALPDLPHWSVFKETARQSGFHKIGFRDATEHILPDALHMRVLCGLVLPITFLWDRWGDRSRRVMANRVSGWLQYRLFRQRILTYGVFVAERSNEPAPE